MPGPGLSSRLCSRLPAFLTLLGLFLTVRGYRSFEGDQAYRLPILLHRQDATLYQDDPFVRSFDRFNPHRGSLTALGMLNQATGLPAALACLFIATFLVTCYGFDRLARSVSPGAGVRPVAVCLLLIAQAGNIGTNHLFEPIWLDRLLAFGLGWLALALAIEPTRFGGLNVAITLGLATLIHPSIGLQLAILLTASKIMWHATLPADRGRWREILVGLLALGAALVPGLALNLRASGGLLHGVAPETLRLLAAELQGPQHMLPHLWRRSQWLAWGCYPVLAFVSLAGSPGGNSARQRLAVMLGVNLAGLAAAWVGIERLDELRLILFQPFRMATVARGLCLALVAGHVLRLWTRGGRIDRLRAVLIAVGLTGDWRLVVVTAFELAMSAADSASRVSAKSWAIGAARALGWVLLAAGIIFLSRHDTESGHQPLLAVAALTWLLGRRVAVRTFPCGDRRAAIRLVACWTLPFAALVANLDPAARTEQGRTFGSRLVRHCRFAQVPLDDIERLAVWCRDHTPVDARFVGPPGPKTFRLWSLRSLAFNRAASPYEAAGLVDWATRFKDHVAFEGTFAELVASYQNGRHALERGYDTLSEAQKADLATRQGAAYVVALARRDEGESRSHAGRLTLMHVEGRYAVYRVDRAGQACRVGPTARSDRGRAY